jgi:hypothetical protein
MKSKTVMADRRFLWLLLAAALVLLAALLPAQARPAPRPAICAPGVDLGE